MNKKKIIGFFILLSFFIIPIVVQIFGARPDDKDIIEYKGDIKETSEVWQMNYFPEQLKIQIDNYGKNSFWTTMYEIDYYNDFSIPILSISSILVSVISSVISSKEKLALKEIKTLREKIYNLIENEPGIHFKDICRVLERNNGVVQYHLRVLEEKQHSIRVFKDGGYSRYFINDSEGRNMELCQIISLLQHEQLNNILHIIANSNTFITRQEIALKLDVTPQSISWNCKKLEENQLIESQILNRKKCYMINNDYLNLINQFI